MKVSRLVVLVGCAMLVGCNELQEGKYSVNGNRAVAIQGQPGELFILSGFTLDDEHQPIGNEHGLLHVVIFEDGAPSVGSSHGYKHEKDLSTIEASYFWDSGAEVVVELRWDRNSELVTVGGSRFNREEGNCVVVVLRNQEIEMVSQVSVQVSSLVPERVLSEIRETGNCCGEFFDGAYVPSMGN